MRICSACGHPLTPDGPCGFASITVGEKTTWLCHARDLAAPSHGSVSSRPSPDATDPRIEAIVLADAGHITLHLEPGDETRYWATKILAAADATDRAADPPWIRIRCDEITEERAIQALMRWINRPDAAMMARAVLAALREAQ